jgi:hypothetical protein
VFEHEVFAQEILTPFIFVKNIIMRRIEKSIEEAKIAGFNSLKQYFEDQKNRTITKSINYGL